MTTISCRRCGGERLDERGNCRQCGAAIWPVKAPKLEDVVNPHYWFVRDGKMLYRRSQTRGFDVYLDGGWTPATGDLIPSEQDENSMREISAAEAKRRMAQS